MAKVLLYTTSLEDPSVNELHRGAYERFVESAALDKFGIHTLTHDPEEADLIIFADVAGQGLFAETIRHHKYTKKFREKCFVFDPGDFSLPFLPGLYASLDRKHYNPTRTRTGYYLRRAENPYLDFHESIENPRYLGSFRGSFSSHPLRLQLALLPKDRFLVEDTTALCEAMKNWSAEDQRDEFYSRYVESIRESAFVLCPRGLGRGSIRLFEAMQLGRAPVILSDDWIYPARVDWDACSISIPEKDLLRIPEILEWYQNRAVELGMRARQEWEKYYAPDVCFHWLVEDCYELLTLRRGSESYAQMRIWLNLLNYRYMRRFMTSKKDMYRRFKKLVL